ncbi:MAG: hypothetical protein QME46_11295 [Thermoanaerobacteraceae bacterium]|nr:hypothetical protein [Thermoanaerobacteraceae bacterium]
MIIKERFKAMETVDEDGARVKRSFPTYHLRYIESEFHHWDSTENEAVLREG